MIGSSLPVLDALKSRYSCLFESPPPGASRRIDNDDDRKRYLTSLSVYGNREVEDEPQSSLPSSNSVGGDGLSNDSKVLDSLKSRYSCLSEPPPTDGRPDNDDDLRRRVFGFTKVTVDLNYIDPLIIKEKIVSVLMDLRFRDPHVLVQFWSRVTVRKRCLLTTLDQPFGLGVVDDEGLYFYRVKSEQRMFVVDGEQREELGPPGRVYRQKLPEWSLDVHTLPDWPACSNIHGYIILPVFEPDSGCCVGVLELVTSSKYIDYAFEVREVSRALKGENLKSPNVFEDSRYKIQVAERQHDLDEILKLLKVVCDNQNLPIAQTWALSGSSSSVANAGKLEGSCSSFTKSCIGKICMSTAVLPFYVPDTSKWGFHEACTQTHLETIRGVVGGSLSSRGTCFCRDVTKLDEDDYPLVSYARSSGLTSCLAIYIKSIQLDAEYVIEFFLPTHSTDKADLHRLMETVKQEIKNNVFSVNLGIMSSLEVIGRDPLNWNIESPPPPITLLTVSEVPQESENIGNEPFNSVTVGPIHSGVPYLEKGITHRKRRRFENAISLEEINKHVGKPFAEAAASLNVSRSTLKRICRSFGMPKWPYSHNKNASEVHIGRMLSTQVIGGVPLDLNLESPPSPITLLTENCDIPPQSKNQQPLVENERIANSVTFSKKQGEVPYVLHMDYTMENTPFNSDAAAVPCLDVGIEDFDTNQVKTGRNNDDKSNKPVEKTKKTDISVGLEEIREHIGESVKELENRLLDMWKRIHESFGIPSQPDGHAQPDITNTEDIQNTAAADMVENLMIKATYRGNREKFRFRLPNRLVKLEEMVARRFQLALGSFKLKYVDKDGDMIWIACDDDLLYTVSEFRQPDNDQTVIILLVWPA